MKIEGDPLNTQYTGVGVGVLGVALFFTCTFFYMDLLEKRDGELNEVTRSDHLKIQT